MFCASQVSWVFLLVMLSKYSDIFVWLKLSLERRSLQVPLVSKKKIWGNHAFLREITEITVITLQFEKECHTLLFILKLFANISHQLSLKNAWLPPVFFLDFNSAC